MTGRGHEVDAEALAVVHGAREPGDLELAAVARARVHLPDRERAAEQPPGPRIDLVEKADDLVPARGQGLGGEADLEDLGEEAHLPAAPLPAQLAEHRLACR